MGLRRRYTSLEVNLSLNAIIPSIVIFISGDFSPLRKLLNLQTNLAIAEVAKIAADSRLSTLQSNSFAADTELIFYHDKLNSLKTACEQRRNAIEQFIQTSNPLLEELLVDTHSLEQLIRYYECISEHSNSVEVSMEISTLQTINGKEFNLPFWCAAPVITNY